MNTYTCSICGKEGNSSEVCMSLKYGDILCMKHKRQFLKYGKFLDSNKRGKLDINEFEIINTHIKIFLYDSIGNIISYTLIDKEDYNIIKDAKITLNNVGYAVLSRDSKSFLLHSLIIKTSKKEVIDHINGDKLDNRKENLRSATKSNNAQNSKIKCNNTSGITGISWDDKRKKWEVYINKDYKKQALGRFNDIEEAKYTRYKAEIEYFKEFTPNIQDKINFIKEYELR